MERDLKEQFEDLKAFAQALSHALPTELHQSLFMSPYFLKHTQESVAEYEGLLLKMAGVLDGTTLFDIGKSYTLTQTKSTDNANARRFFGLAAEKGNLDAHYALANMKLHGCDEVADLQEGIRLLRIAAEGNHVQSQVLLGVVLKENKEHFQEARRLFRLASEQGSVDASYYLSFMLVKGEGGKIDNGKALSLLKFAVESGHEDALSYAVVSATLGDSSAQEILDGLKVRKHSFAKSAVNIAKICISNDNELDFKKARLMLEFAVNQCDSEARFMLSQLYCHGKGCEVDFEKAHDLLELSSQAGFKRAHSALGFLYLEGKLKNSDFEKARRHLCLAPEDDMDASYELGVMQLKGIGGKKDLKKGVKNVLSAAEKGLAMAQCEIAIIYHDGKGVKVDTVQSVKFMQRAADQGLAKAQHTLGVWHLDGNKGVSYNHKEALRLCTLAAQQGNSFAHDCLGMIKSTSKYDALNLKDARKHFKTAKELGNLDSQCSLACMYAHGSGGEKDLKLAHELLKNGAEQNHACSQYHLALLIQNNLIEGTNEEVVKLYEQAAAGSCAMAQQNLAFLLTSGKCGKVDNQKARRLLTLASQKSREAQFLLATMMRDGVGGSVDLKEAASLFRDLANNGDKQAFIETEKIAEKVGNELMNEMKSGSKTRKKKKKQCAKEIVTGESSSQNISHEKETYARQDSRDAVTEKLDVIKLSDLHTSSVDESTVGGETTCIVCFTNPKTHIAAPCAHQSVCETCASKMHKCPYCRAPVSQWMRVRIV